MKLDIDMDMECLEASKRELTDIIVPQIWNNSKPKTLNPRVFGGTVKPEL